MLSRILEDAEVETAELAWHGTQPVRPIARPGTVVTPEHEAANLRARIEQMDAAHQQQVRHAYDSGMREGQAAGMRANEDEVRKVIEKLSASIADVAIARNDALRRAESDIVRLSIEIARRILHRELSLDPSALEALIKAALEKLRTQEIHHVRVHPEHEQLVRACLRQMGRSDEIEIIGDPSQPRGAAVFDISRGSLDASVETQLREIERGFADQLGERQ